MIAVLGAVLVGNHLAEVWPRKVDVAYAVDMEVDGLDVDYLQDGEAVASVRFERTEAKTTLFRHTLRLQPGEYAARFVLYRADGRGIETLRALHVPAAGLTRFDLRGVGGHSE